MKIKSMTFVSALVLSLTGSASARVLLAPTRANVTFVKPTTLTNLNLNLITPRPAAGVVMITLTPTVGSVIPVLPITPIIPSQGVMPANRLLPIMPVRKALPNRKSSVDNVQLSETAANSSPAKSDNLFDGRDEADDKSSDDDRAPVRSGRRIHLPDNLAEEIAAY